MVVCSRTGGDVNGACTLYKHPASDRLSHIGSRVSTAEAKNNGPTTEPSPTPDWSLVTEEVAVPENNSTLEDHLKDK